MADESALRLWAAALAHDLRTPLAALSGEVELALCRERTADAYRDALGRIEGVVTDLLELSGDLSILASAGQAAAMGPPGTFGDALAALKFRPQDDVRPEVTPEARDSPLSADPMLLGRMLTLLVRHACKHKPRESHVHVSAARAGDAVALVIEARDEPLRPADWHHLRLDLPMDGSVRAPGFLALRTSAYIAQRTGSTLTLEPAGSGIVVRVRVAVRDAADAVASP